MSDTPKIQVIDRRKFKAEEEHASEQAAATAVEAASESKAEAVSTGGGPRLVVSESKPEPAKVEAEAAVAEQEALGEIPPAPTAAESHEQKTAYDGASQRLEDLIRAQKPAMGAQPPVPPPTPTPH